MEMEFWHRKWENDETGFHESEANPLLLKNLGALGLAKGSRVFVPLCGKTLDIHWLLAQGYRVAGVELSKIAIEQLFADLGVVPEVAGHGELVHYRARNLDIFVGDAFALSAQALGPVDAVYDRAAYVALSGDMRSRYAAHLMAMTNRAPQLLICYEYDQTLMDGPPFSISDEEVTASYGSTYALALVEKTPIAGGFKGRFPATENVWLLT